MSVLLDTVTLFMLLRRAIYSAFLLMAATACQTIPRVENRPVGSALLVADSDGKEVGRVMLYAEGNAATISIALQGVPAGEYVTFLGRAGNCSTSEASPPADSADQSPMDLGSLPIVPVGENGRGTGSAKLAVSSEALRSLVLDADGTSLIVRAGGENDPTGLQRSSSERIACGTLSPIS